MKRFLSGLGVLLLFGATVVLTGCNNGGGLTKTEKEQLQNPPAPGSTPPPEARAAIQRMQSGPPKGATAPGK